MILSKQKPWEEIVSYLEGQSSVFILGCNGCAQSSGSGGPVQVAEMKGKLEGSGNFYFFAKVILNLRPASFLGNSFGFHFHFQKNRGIAFFNSFARQGI